jgi:neutral trehalase
MDLVALMPWVFVFPQGDVAWLASALPSLEREHSYWMAPPKAVAVYPPATDGEPVTMEPFVLNRYFVDALGPRPESYREDLATAQSPEARAWAAASAEQAGGDKANEAAAARAVYSELATAAESGWDFSTRWMTRTAQTSAGCFTEAREAEGASSAFPLGSSRPTQCVPVDLNCILLKAEDFLARAYAAVADATVAPSTKATGGGRLQAVDKSFFRAAALRFQACASARRAAIEAVLWDSAAGRWRDAWLEPCHINPTNTAPPAPAPPPPPPPPPAGAGAAAAEAVVPSMSAAKLVTFRVIATIADIPPEDPLPAAAQAAANRGAAVPLTTLPFLSDFAPLWAGLADGSPDRQDK